jgi:integrase/recombinase XerD
MTTLRKAVQQYVRMRRNLGFKLHDASKGLLDFARFMEQHRASYITQALAWAQQPLHVQPAHWAQRLSFVRGFAQYRSATDPRTQIPAKGLLPFRPKRARPHLYSNAEIQGLLRAALKMPYRYERGKLRPWVYHCLFGLLSVSGLRVGEARNLELQDVDLKTAVLTIRGAKFGKIRLVPLHHSTCRILAEYISRRNRHWRQRAVSSYLFVSSSKEAGRVRDGLCPALGYSPTGVRRHRCTNRLVPRLGGPRKEQGAVSPDLELPSAWRDQGCRARLAFLPGPDTAPSDDRFS